MKLSIIIPSHNEGKTLGEILGRVFGTSIPCEKEVIVVNDGSSDNTAEVLENFKKSGLKIINHEKNLGKGAAIKTGLKEATGSMVIIQDADLEYFPEDIPRLIEALTEETSAVYGNRGTKRWPKRGYHYVLGAKILTETTNILYGTKLNDVYTGYKLFNLEKINKNLFEKLESKGFEFEAEITCEILNHAGKIVEVPIQYMPRNIEEGKHIGFKDAIKGFIMILKCFFRKT